MENELMMRKFWGVPEVARYTKTALATAHVWCNSKGFPDPEVLLGTRTKGWKREDVIAWWKARQKTKKKKVA